MDNDIDTTHPLRTMTQCSEAPNINDNPQLPTNEANCPQMKMDARMMTNTQKRTQMDDKDTIRTQNEDMPGQCHNEDMTGGTHDGTRTWNQDTEQGHMRTTPQ